MLLIPLLLNFYSPATEMCGNNTTKVQIQVTASPTVPFEEKFVHDQQQSKINQFNDISNVQRHTTESDRQTSLGKTI